MTDVTSLDSGTAAFTTAAAAAATYGTSIGSQAVSSAAVLQTETVMVDARAASGRGRTPRVTPTTHFIHTIESTPGIYGAHCIHFFKSAVCRTVYCRLRLFPNISQHSVL
ncbi:hypothetical protein VOLCADRAFT_99242, partial [Volvox carteri f. nagariensis]